MTEGLCKARLKKQGCLSIYGIVTTTKHQQFTNDIKLL